MSKKTLYDIREYVGSEYSRSLGSYLRPYRQAAKIARRLKQRGRDIVLVGIEVNLTTDQQAQYKFTCNSWIDIVPTRDE